MSGMAEHTRILIGLVIGAAAGLAVNQCLGGDHPAVVWTIRNVTEPVGTLFLTLLLMTVVPLVFSSLVCGVASVGDVRRLGRIGAKSFGYTLVISAIAVVIGLTLANTIRPGERISPETAAALRERDSRRAVEEVKKAAASAPADAPLMAVVKGLVPANPIAAAAKPDMLQVMFFSLLLGIAATTVAPAAAAPFLEAVRGLFEITARVINIIMAAAPFAVACLLFNNTAAFGIDLLAALSWFVATVLLALGLHMFVVYSASVRLLSGIPPLEFFRRCRTAILTAFSTSSSNATLPTALKVGEEELGIPKELNSFVLTVGATANQNGTALYEGVTVLFIAQLAGADLTLGEQLAVVYLAVLGGIGTAGVPSGSIPFIIGVLAGLQKQHPTIRPEMIAVIMGVDRILDMCRTVLNVVGDLTIATFVARSEGYEWMPVRPRESAPPGGSDPPGPTA